MGFFIVFQKRVFVFANLDCYESTGSECNYAKAFLEMASENARTCAHVISTAPLSFKVLVYINRLRIMRARYFEGDSAPN